MSKLENYERMVIISTSCVSCNSMIYVIGVMDDLKEGFCLSRKRNTFWMIHQHASSTKISLDTVADITSDDYKGLTIEFERLIKMINDGEIKYDSSYGGLLMADLSSIGESMVFKLKSEIIDLIPDLYKITTDTPYRFIYQLDNMILTAIIKNRREEIKFKETLLENVLGRMNGDDDGEEEGVIYN